jgi:hypothetical protein
MLSVVMLNVMAQKEEECQYGTALECTVSLQKIFQSFFGSTPFQACSVPAH